MYFLKSYPLPNFNNPLSSCPKGLNGYAICSNYLGPVASSQNPYDISVKLDHQISEKNHFFVEFLSSPGQYNIYQTPWTGPTVPYTGYGGDTPYTFTSEVAGVGHTSFQSDLFQ